MELDVMGIRKQGPVIAIDGPAGTGKSSVTKRLAEGLGFVHVDTGALYRAIALLCLDRGLELDVEKLSPSICEQITELARSTHLEFKRMAKLNPANRLFANGVDVTPRIRTPEVSMGASKVSAVPEVRAALLGLQRQLGCNGKSILEGRDIGTVVFPDADVKFYMTATVEERAKRRLAELEATGADTPSFEEVKRQMALRDRGDSERAVAPLRKAEGAIEIDTTPMTLDEVVEKMQSLVIARLGLKK
jgi:cytidylate kinase